MKRLAVFILLALPALADDAVETRLRELRSEDPARRRAAGDALARIGETAIEGLEAALAEENWEVRKEAARSLAAIGSEAAQKGLAAAMGDKVWGVREAAAAGLRKGAALDAAAKDAVWRVRAAAAVAAAKSDPATARVLLADGEKPVRRAAAAAIAATGNPEFRAEMRDMLRGDESQDLGLDLFAKIGTPEDAVAVRPIFTVADPALAARALRSAYEAKLDVTADVDRYIDLAASLRGMAGRENQERFGAMLTGLESMGPCAWAGIANRLDKLDDGITAEFAVILSRAGDARTKPALLKLLKKPDPDVRYLALSALDRVDPKAAEENAASLLGDSAPGVRVEAAVVLSRTADGRAALIEKWESLDAAARHVALGALQGDAALDVRGLMSKVLRSAEAWERRQAHDWFARHKDQDYLGAVEQHFAREQDDDNRCCILANLESMAGSHRELFRAAARDPSASVRLLAMRALGGLREPDLGATLRRGVADESALVRERALQGLFTFEGLADLPTFTNALFDPEMGVRETAARLLGKSPRAGSLLELAFAAKDPATGVRLAAIEALGGFPEELAAPLLRNLIQNEDDPLVRCSAARAAARFRSSAEFLSGLAKAEPSGTVRAALVDAAVEAGGKGAAGLLRQLVDDTDPRVRERVAAGLGRIPDTADLKALMKLSGDGDVSVRISAAAAIGQIPGKEALEALKVCASDASDAVRSTSYAALVHRGDRDAVVKWLETDPNSAELRGEIAAALDEGGSPRDALALLDAGRNLTHGGLALAGWCAVELRMWEVARLWFERAAQKGEPNDTGWDWAVLARALQAAEEGRPEAEGLIRQAVESSGHPPSTAANASYLLADAMLLPTLALELAERAAAEPEPNADILDTLGWAQLQSGHVADADRTLSAIDGVTQAIGFFHRAVAQAANGRPEAAAASLREALNREPKLSDRAHQQDLLKPLFDRPELETWK